MRLRLYVLTAMLALPFAISNAPAQQQQLGTVPQQELDVIKVLTAQETAWNNGDLETFAQAYKDSPDTLFVTNVVNRGYAGLAEAYKRDYPTRTSMGTLGFSELEVRSLDERYAVVIGRYRLERNKKDGGPATGLFTLVMEKTDKGWKIIIDHTTG